MNLRYITKDFIFKVNELHVKAIAESSTDKLVPSLLMPKFTVISLTSSECICVYSIWLYLKPTDFSLSV